MSFSIFSFTNLLPRYHSSAENNVCSVQDPRLCTHISRLQTPTVPHICCKFIQGMYSSEVTEFCSDHYNLIAMYYSYYAWLAYGCHENNTFLALFISLELILK